MGCGSSSGGGGEHNFGEGSQISDKSIARSDVNVHKTHENIKVHTIVTKEMDYDHQAALLIPLGELSDEQLVAELAERDMKVDNEDFDPETFDMDSHAKAMKIPLEAVTDDELVNEVRRRALNIHEKVNENLVNEVYEIGKEVGRGASGKVYVCKNREDLQLYACKVIERDSSMNDAQSMSTELEIMKRLKHENIVMMYEVFQSPRCLWLILELVDGGDLRSYLRGRRRVQPPQPYTEPMAARHMYQILSGVHYLHSEGVVHRDLKLENILLKINGPYYDVKIADFGLSALVRIGENGYHGSKSSKRKEFTGLSEPWGTAEYESPELLAGAYGPQADMWAIGCMMYEILAGEKAFSRTPGEKSLEKLQQRIKRGVISMKSPIWNKVDSNAKNLICKLIEVDPKKRFSATEAKRHKWITMHEKEYAPFTTAKSDSMDTNDKPASPIGTMTAVRAPSKWENQSPRKSSPRVSRPSPVTGRAVSAETLDHIAYVDDENKRSTGALFTQRISSGIDVFIEDDLCEDMNDALYSARLTINEPDDDFNVKEGRYNRGSTNLGRQSVNRATSVASNSGNNSPNQRRQNAGQSGAQANKSNEIMSATAISVPVAPLKPSAPSLTSVPIRSPRVTLGSLVPGGSPATASQMAEQRGPN